MQVEEPQTQRKRKPVTLKTIAERVGLAPCSISAVLNNSPAARGIPQHTKDRVLRVASQLKYQPNFAARSLRTRRTHSVAVLVRDLGNPCVATALAGIELRVRARGYLLMLSAWDGTAESLGDHLLRLRQRGMEGMVLIGGSIQPNLSIPVVLAEIDDVKPARDGAADLQRLRANGEAAANTLIDQIEALARVGSSYEPPFWLHRAQNSSVSFS